MNLEQQEQNYIKLAGHCFQVLTALSMAGYGKWAEQATVHFLPVSTADLLSSFYNSEATS